MKKRGRPATGAGHTIGVRLQPDDLQALDQFIESRAASTSRPEAIREILRITLKLLADGNAALRRNLVT